jgi:hypothetical protein
MPEKQKKNNGLEFRRTSERCPVRQQVWAFPSMNSI